MSLVDLIGQADDRGLTASGLACLDRCVPLLGGDDEVLRPLWGSLTEGSGGDWGESLEQVRGKLVAPEESEGNEAALLAHRMLAAAPAGRTTAEVRQWADACSVASLRIHGILDPAEDASPADTLERIRAGETPAEGCLVSVPPLVAAELRRQISVLELLAEHGAGGLRPALDVSTEGRRVLRAVVSRRARGAQGARARS